MATFDVLGPFELPTIKGRSGGRTIDTGREALDEFWNDVECADEAGCYIFAVRYPRGLVPYFIGRTSGAFRAECFQASKVAKYTSVVADVRRGTPVLFFLPLARTRGRVNEAAIKSLEDTLLKIAFKRNAEIANISASQDLEVVVRGVWDTRRPGRPNAAITRFNQMMGLE